MLFKKLLPLLIGDDYAGLAFAGSVAVDNSPYDVQRQWCWSSGLAGGATFQPGASASRSTSAGAVSGKVQQ